jgi:hypothetical protein
MAADPRGVSPQWAASGQSLDSLDGLTNVLAAVSSRYRGIIGPPGLHSNDADRPTGEMDLALFEQAQDLPETSSASAFVGAPRRLGFAHRCEDLSVRSRAPGSSPSYCRIAVQHASLAVLS